MRSRESAALSREILDGFEEYRRPARHPYTLMTERSRALGEKASARETEMLLVRGSLFAGTVAGARWKEIRAALEEAIVERDVCSFQARTERTDRKLRGIDVRDFVDNLFRSVEASRQRTDGIRAEYDAYLASLGEFEERKQSIVKVRRGLEYLAAEPSEGRRLSEWFDFVAGTAEKTKLAPLPK